MSDVDGRNVGMNHLSAACKPHQVSVLAGIDGLLASYSVTKCILRTVTNKLRWTLYYNIFMFGTLETVDRKSVV